MATNPSTLVENAGRITAPDANYLYGSAQDDSTGTAGDGTPFKSALLNDIYGFQQAMLSEAGIVPTGNSDTAIASQYLDALKVLFPLKTAAAEISGTWEWQDSTSVFFGSDADVEIDYDPTGGGSLDVDLSGSTDLRIKDNGVVRLAYDNGLDRFHLQSGEFLFADDIPLQFGSSTKAEIDYDQGANSFDIGLGPTTDMRVRDDGATMVQYDSSTGGFVFRNGASIHTLDDQIIAFGAGVDAFVHYDSADDALEINLSATADMLLKNDGTPVLQYDNSTGAFVFRNGAAIHIHDDALLALGSGADTYLNYASAADSLDVHLDATADFRLFVDSVIKYQYDNGASEHVFTDNIIVTDQIRNTNDPLTADDLARKLYVDTRLADSTLFSGSITATNTGTLSETMLNFKQILVKVTRGGEFVWTTIPVGTLVLSQIYRVNCAGNGENEAHACDFKFNTVTEIEAVDTDGTNNPIVTVVGAFRI